MRDTDVKKEKAPLARGRTAREDTAAVMRAFELPARFPKGVLAEAKRAAGRLEGPGAGRLDLRKKFIFTCDPETAKDFDDALSLERDRAGNRVLGVHIADVSHFVPPGGALDREAYARGNSVYLIDRVVPMLPEALSNGVCSLVPNEDRLAFSAFLTFDAQGRMISRRFAKSVIRSKARFTYAQVLDALVAPKPPKVRGAKTVRDISALAQQLRANRFAAGALDLAVPEMEIRLDPEGEIASVETRVSDVSHQLVEECMVAANEAVAKELWTRGVKIPARLHEPPDPERMDELRADLAALGIRCGDLTHGKNTALFLAKIKGHPLEATIGLMVLRSMKRAEYNARKIGHWGLAKAHYAHFTSPIRRYPDLILHRQLTSWLAGTGGRLEQGYLDRACEHLSETEERAAEAERMLDTVKKFRYLEQHAAESFAATVSRVASFGIFVDVADVPVSGMVHVSHLSHRYVTYNEANRTLGDGRRTWSVGAAVRVRLLKVDWINQWADFTLDADAPRRDAAPQADAPSPTAPKSRHSAHGPRRGRRR